MSRSDNEAYTKIAITAIIAVIVLFPFIPFIILYQWLRPKFSKNKTPRKR